MAGWRDAPIVSGPTAAAAPAWQSAPVVQPTPATAATPEPGLDVPGVDYSGVDATPEAAPASVIPREVMLPLAAATKGVLADNPLSVGVDLTSAGLNAGSTLLNGLFHTNLPAIKDPAFGTNWMAQRGGDAYKAVTGQDVPQPETPGERIGYGATELGANAVATEGLGSLFKQIARLMDRPMVAPETTTTSPIFRGEAPSGPTAGTAARAGLAGAGAGATEAAYHEYGSEHVKKVPVVGPFLDALADTGSLLAGGVGAGALGEVGRAGAKVAAAPFKAAKDVVLPKPGFVMQDGTVPSQRNLDAAASIVQNRAADISRARQEVADTSRDLSTTTRNLPTVGAMSGDPGLIDLEKQLRTEPEAAPAFVQRDREVRQAALDAANRIAPETAVGRTFTDTADAISQKGVKDALPIDSARGSKPTASEALAPVVKDTLTSAQDRKNSAFKAIDPNDEVRRPAAPFTDATKTIRDSSGSMSDPALQPGAIMDRIDKAAEAGDGTVSFKDINALRPEISQRIAQARAAGDGELAKNLEVIKKTINEDAESLANEGNDAGKRAQAALDIYKNEFAPIWNRGPGDAATKFRKDFNKDRFEGTRTEDSQVAGRFLQPGQPEKAESLKRVIDSSATPGEGRKAASDYLLGDLADSGAVGPSGKLDPQKIKVWESKWGPTLDTVPGFRGQIDDIKKMADEAAQNEKAFAHVTGKDPVEAVKSILGSDDPEREMRDIVARVGKGSAAHDGIKASILQYLKEEATGTAEHATSTGEYALSPAAVANLFKKNERVLAEVLSPDEMASLQQSRMMLSKLKNLEQQATPGSQTADKLAGREKLMRYMEVAIKATQGGLRGGNTMRNIKLLAALNGGGPDQVKKLLVEMQFNPDLADHLFGRVVKGAKPKNFDAGRYMSLVVGGTVARRNVHNDNPNVLKITVGGNASKTPANSVEKN